MQTHNLGYPRIGAQRELKKACEQYWSGKISYEQLEQTGKNIRLENWKIQKQAGIDIIPCNDFSFYDQVLDMTLTTGAIPERYADIAMRPDLYFAMARGCQEHGIDITAMEMTKWFDTNYHYLVPEFLKNQQFTLNSNKIFNEFAEAKALGINAKPVIIGPVSYLLLGKEKEANFDKIDLVENLLPVYLQILSKLGTQGAEYIQFDEPFLTMALHHQEKTAYEFVYRQIRKLFPDLKFIIATYFGGLQDNLALAVNLPADVLHIDLVRDAGQLENVLKAIPAHLRLSLGIVDGRNIWKNDFQKSLNFIQQAAEALGHEKLLLAPSCSLLHTPCDLNLEKSLDAEIRNWLAFARQKIDELVTLKAIATGSTEEKIVSRLQENTRAVESRKTSVRIHNPVVQRRVQSIDQHYSRRKSAFAIRKAEQQRILKLPLFPTTTIGSFPQTAEVRSWRAKFKKG